MQPKASLYEKATTNLVNKLMELRAKVVTEEEEFMHTSAHPCQGELREIYALTRPKVSIPVTRHIYKHAELAESFGVPKVIRVNHGNSGAFRPRELVYNRQGTKRLRGDRR